MAEPNKTTQDKSTTTGSNPGTTADRTSTASGQSGYSGGTSGTTGGSGTTGSTSSTGSMSGGTSSGMSGSATQRAQSQSGGASYGGGQGAGQAGEVMGQAKQAVTDAYERTSRTVNDTYHQAMDYGRENPGTMTLIAFGAGVAVGLLIAGGFAGSRSRTSRLVPPVMNALSEIASEFIR
jgi:ElaB/YqjD/DUF883 family membrane-anchored ribosome-binding protein